MAEQENKRSKNIFSQPEFQFKKIMLLITLVFSIGSLILFLMNSNMINNIYQIMSNNQIAIGVIVQIAESLTYINFISFATFLFFGFFVLVLMLLLSKKISGPKYVILQILKEMQEGNYSITRKLRKNDEMQDVYEEILKLAEKLRR